MKRVLIIRGLALEVAPLFAAAIISRYTLQFGAFALIVAGLLILLHSALCIRDGVFLASAAGVLDFRSKEPFMFWLGMCVHFCVAAFCFFAAGIIIFRKT